MNNPKTNYKFNDFPVETKVKIISKVVDFYFWYGETGEVIKNDGDYLGIEVQLDSPRHFEDGYIQTSFNFNPDNLCPISELKMYEGVEWPKEAEFWE